MVCTRPRGISYVGACLLLRVQMLRSEVQSEKRVATIAATSAGVTVLLASPAGGQELPLPPEVQQSVDAMPVEAPSFPDLPPIDVTEQIEDFVGQIPIQLPEPRVQAGDLPNQDVEESYVSFGDSVASNPSQMDIAATRLKGVDPGYSWPTIRDGRCAQGVGNFPSRTAEKTGLRLADYSCGGATAYTLGTPDDAIPHNTLNEQVDQAINDGNLDGRTQLVSISIGVNDFYLPGNGPEIGQDERNRRYDEAVGGAIEKIQQAAPNARVILTGLPDQTDGANHTCPTNIYGVVSRWYFPFVSYYQDELRNSQRRVSEQHNIDYLDMVSEINLANGNNGCSTNPGRLSASIFDDAPHNFTFHLTDAGNEYYANRIVETLNS